MKKTKKFLALIFAAVASASLCFAACDSGEEEQGQTPNTHTHTFNESTWVNTDPEYHWHPATCEHADEQGSRTRHTFTETVLTATCTEAGTVHRHCDVCGYDADVEVEALGHQLVAVEALAPTCEVDGHTQYFVCSRCDYTEGYQIIRHTGEHRYSSEWSYDGLNHWHANLCGCGRLGETAEHEYGEDGTCTVCGYKGATDEEVEAIYTLTTNGDEYTVTGLAEGATETELTLPAMYKGKKVTGLASYAFEGNTTITKVTIGAWYTNLGEQVFEGCTALQSVTLAMSKVSINDNMFHGCTSLSELVLGGEITWIGRQAFGRCTSLKEITLTNACTFIGQNAFRGSGLTSVVVPDSVTTVGSYAFAECASLETATVGVGVPYFFGGWFMDSPALKELTVPFVGSNVSADDAVTTAFGYFFGMEEPAAADSFMAVEQEGVTYYIPKTLESVTVTGGTIASGAFDGCSMLKTITANEQVEVLTKTFEGCTAEFTWLGHEVETPEGLDVTLTLSRGTVYTEREVRVNLAVTAEAEVTIIVMKGEQEAEEETDYTYNEDAGTIVFHTAGEYTVTASATLGNETKESSASITVVATPPTLTNVSLGKTACVTDEELTLSYESNGTVTVTVKKGEQAAAATDYTYNADTKKLTFLTAGSYTVVLTAARDGLESTRSVAVTVEWRAPTLSDVTVDKGTVLKGETATLTFTEEVGSEVTYEVKKDGSAATSEDYEQNGKTFTFKTAGEFTITVKATLHEKTTQKSVKVNVLDPSTLSVVISADKEQAKEGEELTITATANPVPGDAVSTETYTVQQKHGDDYENANPDYYTWTDAEHHTKIRFNVEGTYKIIYSVTTEKGADAWSEVVITVTGSVLELTLEAHDGAWILAKTNEQKTISYTITGDTAAYNVTYKANVEGAEINAASDGTAVTVKYATSETVTFTVTYTHKTLEEKVYTLDIPVSFVDDVENAPRFGADPFGGTAGKLIPSTALQLYFDVADKSGAALTYDEVTFELVEGTNTTGVTVSIGTVADTNYPFALVEDWGNGNTANGEFAVKLTATKDGKSAVSTKKFTVAPLEDPTDVVGINKYIDEIYPGMRGAMNLDRIVSGQHRENMVITKEGIFVHRSGSDDWNPDQSGKGLLVVTWEGGDGSTAFSDNFQLDFEYTIIKRTNAGTPNKVSFAVNYRTGSWNGYCGSQTAFYAENSDETISCASWGGYNGDERGWEGGAGKPSATPGSHIYIRLQHTVSDGKVHFVWTWSSNGQTYNPWYNYNSDVSSADSEMGAPIYAMQFNNEQGTYHIGNFKLIALGAE